MTGLLLVIALLGQGGVAAPSLGAPLRVTLSTIPTRIIVGKLRSIDANSLRLQESGGALTTVDLKEITKLEQGRVVKRFSKRGAIIGAAAYVSYVGVGLANDSDALRGSGAIVFTLLLAGITYLGGWIDARYEYAEWREIPVPSSAIDSATLTAVRQEIGGRFRARSSVPSYWKESPYAAVAKGGFAACCFPAVALDDQLGADHHRLVQHALRAHVVTSGSARRSPDGSQ